MKSSILQILVIVICCQAHAQTDGYVPLRSTGLMPEDFRNIVKNKIENEIDVEVYDTDHHGVKKSKTAFLLKSNYMLYNILTSGYVLYNEEVSNYVSEVFRNVREGSGLGTEARVYVIKSSVSNAFATNQGIIFVTTGLLAQLENEAQLAYILGHEVTHFERKHSIHQYVDNDRYSNRKRNYRNKHYDDYIAQMSDYSKKLELEADSVAFTILNNSVYDLKASLSVFDVLQFSHLPFDEIGFPKALFESENFTLPRALYLDTANTINFDDDYDDANSSHPNIRKRKDAIQKMLSEIAYKKGKVFVNEASAFHRVQKKCRNEVLRLLLRNGHYMEAFYNANVLYRLEPTQKYYRECMAKALYGIAKYSNISKFNHKSFDEIEGGLSRYYFFFENMETEALSLICLNAMMKINGELQDPFIDRLIKNLATDVVFMHEIAPEDLKFTRYDSTSTDTVTVHEKSAETADTTRNGSGFFSKYDKLRNMRNNWKENQSDALEEQGPGKYYLHVFVDSDQEKITELFNHAQKEKERILLANEKNDNENLSSYERRKKERDALKSDKKNGAKLGIDKLVYVDPEYFSVDERKGLKQVNSEINQIDFVNSIKKNARKAALETTVISPKLFDESSTEHLNDLGVLNAWMGEMLKHREYTFKNAFIPLESNYIQELEQKYGTTHFSYSGVVTYKTKKNNIGQLIFYSLLVYPTLPITIAYAILPKHISMYYHVICSTTEPEVIYRDFTEQKIKMNKGNVNSLMYDKLVQFKDQPNEK